MQNILIPGYLFQDRGDSARAMDILNVPGSGGTDLAEVGNLFRNFLNTIKVIIDFAFVCNRQPMQNRIGRAAHSHIQGIGIVQRFGRDDHAGSDLLFNQLQDQPGCLHFQALPAPGVLARAVPLNGKAIPNASIRQFMLLAVNMPEHEPQEGQALFSNSFNCASPIFPA